MENNVLFNRVVEHLRKQGSYASIDGQIARWGTNNTRSAIGLIVNGNNDTEHEAFQKAAMEAGIEKHNWPLLIELESAHSLLPGPIYQSNKSMLEFEKSIKKIAEKYKLEYKEPT